MQKAASLDYLSFPDNPIVRFSTDGITCASVTWQSAESAPSELTHLFAELRSIPQLPPRRQRAAYRKVEASLSDIESMDDGAAQTAAP
jgi:hypothetical protein